MTSQRPVTNMTGKEGGGIHVEEKSCFRPGKLLEFQNFKKPLFSQPLPQYIFNAIRKVPNTWDQGISKSFFLINSIQQQQQQLYLYPTREQGRYQMQDSEKIQLTKELIQLTCPQNITCNKQFLGFLTFSFLFFSFQLAISVSLFQFVQIFVTGKCGEKQSTKNQIVQNQSDKI